MGEALTAEAVRFVTAGQAGEELGVSRQRVGKLVERWPEVKNPVTGKIDIARLKELRAANADPLKQMAYQHAARARATEAESDAAVAPTVRKVAAARAEQEKDDESDEQGEVNLERASFTEAKTHRERSNARLAELRVLELEGQLISRREVESLNFAIARRIRDRLEGLPAKLQQYIMPDAMPMLDNEIKEVLKQLAEDAAQAVDEAEL